MLIIKKSQNNQNFLSQSLQQMLSEIKQILSKYGSNLVSLNSPDNNGNISLLVSSPAQNTQNLIPNQLPPELNNLTAKNDNELLYAKQQLEQWVQQQLSNSVSSGLAQQNPQALQNLRQRLEFLVRQKLAQLDDQIS